VAALVDAKEPAQFQISLVDAEYAGKRKMTRREVFLQEMELVVPWKATSGSSGMKAHIGVDADSGLVHTVTTLQPMKRTSNRWATCCTARPTHQVNGCR